MKDAPAEVLDNPEYLLDGPTAANSPKEKRLRACITGADGRFCIRDLRVT